jgi:hypothetical protein
MATQTIITPYVNEIGKAQDYELKHGINWLFVKNSLSGRSPCLT